MVLLDKVIDHVYLSGAGPLLSAKGHEAISKLDITHVLTVSASAIPEDKHIKDLDYKFIFAMDMPKNDLLSRLAEGVQFIEDAVQNGGNILVHCEMGASRSATFVAAYLMKKFSWSAEKAVTYIQSSRPCAQPNEGFMEQLHIFQFMDYQADSGSLSSCKQYRTWCMKNGLRPDYAAAVQTDPSTSEETPAPKNPGNKFRCGKCRQAVFFTEHLMEHNRTDGEKCTFGYLIEPMKWMQIDEYQGKIGCPSCGEKLGNYCWGGRQCQGEHGMKCFEQVQPWVHLHKTKVDEVTARIPLEKIQRIPTADLPAVVISEQ